MSVKIRKRKDAWWIFVNHQGRRKAKKVGTLEAAKIVKAQLDARLALGDLNCLAEPELDPPFAEYSKDWFASEKLRCKPSTLDSYRDYNDRYVLPRFGLLKLTEIKRKLIKAYLADLSEKGLAKNTIRLALVPLRVILSSAVEDGKLESNPAFRLGRFLKSDVPEHEAQAMEPEEVEAFLDAAREYCPEYHALFLIALRAGLRQGEILALRWGDFQFGKTADDPNRYILVARRWYRGRFSTPKGNRTRRVDMSRELREAVLARRDERLMQAWQRGATSISDELVFPGETTARPISVRTLSENYFLPSLERANLRRFRFHDLRHTFGSLLIEAGAPLPYVKDQMGHSSIAITADKYVHLLSGRNVRFIDRLDALKLSATQTQPEQNSASEEKQKSPTSHWKESLVRKGGVEPPRVTPPDPKSGASANSATFANAEY
jgi:integrase